MARNAPKKKPNRKKPRKSKTEPGRPPAPSKPQARNRARARAAQASRAAQTSRAAQASRKSPEPLDNPRLSDAPERRPPTPTRETHLRRLARESLALIIFAVSIYLFLSLSAGRSLCGPIGETLRAFFISVCGLPASYLLTGLLFSLGIFNLLDKPLSMNGLSVSGLVLSVMALATLVAIPEVVPASAENGIVVALVTERALDNGGIVGGNLAGFLVQKFNLFGAFLITLTIGFVALIVATDRWALRAVVHAARAMIRFVASPAPPLHEPGEGTRQPASPSRPAPGSTLWASTEANRPVHAPVVAPQPRPTRKQVVMVARACDAPPEPATRTAPESAKTTPTPQAAPSKKKNEPADAPPRTRPRPAPVIRAAGSNATITTAPRNRPTAPTGGPIEPPALRHFAGLPADSSYVFPSLDLLDNLTYTDQDKEQVAIRKRAEILVRALTDFRISAEVVEIQKGPVITMFEIGLAPGTKLKQVANLSDDLAMALKAPSVRIVAPIPGKSTVGVEVPNLIREEVNLKDLVTHPDFRKSTAALPLLLGKDGQGTPLIEDLAGMPHLLVAGATGAGKSVCLNTIILSLLLTRRPEEAQLILIDPKMVELSQFRRIPHLMTPVVTDMRRAPGILDWAVQRMDDRYSLLHDAGVRHLVSYNKLSSTERKERLEEAGRDPESAPPYLPYIVIMVDEMADLMITNAKEVEAHIIRLAQKSRAVGIHLVMATQRPSADVITGLIKANMPTRIAFKVSSRTDSRIVVDQNGAEKLLGMGDMLYMPPRSPNLMRCQGTYVSDEEIRRIVRHVKQYSKTQLDEGLDNMSSPRKSRGKTDELYEEAVRTVLETGRGSTSLLQRKFQIGYTRAARLVDLMAQEGILGKYKGSQAREVLVSLEEWERTHKAGAS